MKCISCGKQIPDESAFCNHCGAPQNAEPRKAGKKKRGNGQGSVYKRNGKWAAQITVGYYMENGKHKRKIRRKCGFATKREAIAYIETLRADKQTKSATFGALYESFCAVEMERLSESKAKAYRIAWGKIADGIRFRSADDMTVSQLQELTDTAGASYYTKRDIKNLLSHLYSIAIRDDFADKNKAKYISLPQQETKERTVFTEKEIAALWAASDEYIVKHMLVMIYTGIRPAELLSIRLENVHLGGHYMTGGVKTRKSKARKIIIPDKLTGIMRDLIAQATGDRLTNYIKHQFYDAWNDYKKTAGIRDELSPYCCRHTYITRLTALRVSPAMLQELAGHEDYETTLEYTHLSVADRLAEVNRLA